MARPATRTVTYFARFRVRRRWSAARLEAAVEAIRLRPLTIIFNDDFATLSLDEVMTPDAEKPLNRPLEAVNAKTISALPAYLAGLYRVPLLSPYGEQFLFRKLNYLRHWVSVLRERLLKASGPRRDLVETIEGMFEEIDRIRGRIIECNLRLVVSISRRFSDSRNGFEELVSEGNLILMKAVDRFDYGRGFRFSTYATHAVQRHIFRLFQTRQKRRKREQITAGEVLGDLLPPVVDEVRLDPQGDVRKLLGKWGTCLDEREQYIIRTRFGVGGEPELRTLRDLSSELGISKERVRQVQIRAMDKLRELAEDHKIGLEHRPLVEPGEEFEAAMA